MTDAVLFAEPEEPEDLSAPTGPNLSKWLAADPARRVAVLAPDASQANDWAQARGVPRNRLVMVQSAATLQGMYGDEHVIVRVQGPGGKSIKAEKRLMTAISVCHAGGVHFIEDVIPMEAAAPVSQTIGGAELYSADGPDSPVRVMPRHHGQGDTFTIGIDGDHYDISRANVDELVEVIAAWKESRPYVDAAAARAAEIRAAILASGDPFALPPPKR